MTPHWGDTFLFSSCQQLPCFASQTLERLFELGPSPHLMSCLQGQRTNDAVRCARLGAKVTGHLQEYLTQTLILCL